MVSIAVKNKKNKKTKKQEQAVDLLRNKWAYYFLFSFIFILLFHFACCLLAWVESKISGLTEISALISE